MAQVRADVIERLDSPFGQCDTISRDAAAELSGQGVEARVVKGRFEIDWPAPDLFSHTWLELGDQLIDGSAEQFNEWLRTPMPAGLVIARRRSIRHQERPALAS